METEKSDYRLEKWIAILLSLLFLVPFVARGAEKTELLLPGFFHGEEVPHGNGEEWLALVETRHGAMLNPARILIDLEHDPIIDLPNQKTGKRVTVIGADEPLFLMRGRVAPGPVKTAKISNHELELPKSVDITLGSHRYSLRFDCQPSSGRDEEGIPCRLLLETGHSAQQLSIFHGSRDSENRLVFAADALPAVLWAGDLDRDGELDLVIDVSDHYNVSAPTLFLSTAARDEELVGRVAAMVVTGC